MESGMGEEEEDDEDEEQKEQEEEPQRIYPQAAAQLSRASALQCEAGLTYAAHQHGSNKT